jgi:hypothetical protein
MTALDDRGREHELDPLKKVGDDYPKYLLTLDFIAGDYEGVKQANLIGFWRSNACLILFTHL